MITRIYIDNYKCFSNFEYQPGKNQLLLGTNGTGKSSVFDALHLLRSLVVDGRAIDEIARPETRTRWQTSFLQEFGVALSGNGGVYDYAVTVSNGSDPRGARILGEVLRYAELPTGLPHLLLDRNVDAAELYRDDLTPGRVGFADSSRSGLFVIEPHEDYTRLAWFKERMERILCLRMDPLSMATTSEKEAPTPDRTMANFASWYRHLVQEAGDVQAPLFERLREVFGPEFAWLKLEREGGDVRALCAGFRPEGGETASYRFGELSDGQRALIALYTLTGYLSAPDSGPKEGFTLCMDEPENYVALRELQPWILEMDDITSATDVQVLIASHHPEFINYYARTDAVRFTRDNGGAARVVPLVASEDDPLLPSETVARGWEDG